MNDITRWLSLMTLCLYVLGVFVTAEYGLRPGMIFILAGACLFFLIGKKNKEARKWS